MRLCIKKIGVMVTCILAMTVSCEDNLNEEIFDSLGPENFFNTEEDAEALLNGVYSQFVWRGITIRLLAFNEATTDILLQRGGGIHSIFLPLETFQFTTDNEYLAEVWDRWYKGINRANVLLDNVPNIEMNEKRKNQVLAEARFLRAAYYFYLNDIFGPVPIVLSSKSSVNDRPNRPSVDDFNNFLEDEFLSASVVLNENAQQFGRAPKGAALGYLSKLYLNTKQWEKAASTAKLIIDKGTYSLFTDGNRIELFSKENKINDEFIFVAPFPFEPTSPLSNSYFNVAAPPKYRFEYPPKINFAANFQIRSDFVDLFEEDDQRRDAFIFEFIDTDGNLVDLGKDNIRSFKYPEDPSPNADGGSNDHPLLRYADILLIRAEALNQMNGPNQESIDLINQVRGAAEASLITIGSFVGKDELHAFILDERGREFHSEGLRRQDLIRHGKFIDYAIDRGHPAQPKNLVFPIPQDEVGKNENLTQNDGY